MAKFAYSPRNKPNLTDIYTSPLEVRRDTNKINICFVQIDNSASASRVKFVHRNVCAPVIGISRPKCAPSL